MLKLKRGVNKISVEINKTPTLDSGNVGCQNLLYGLPVVINEEKIISHRSS